MLFDFLQNINLIFYLKCHKVRNRTRTKTNDEDKMDNNEYHNNNEPQDHQNDDLLDSLGKKIEEANGSGSQDNSSTASDLPILIELLPDLLQEMYRKGIPYAIEGTTGNVIVDGFYKSGPMTLIMDKDFAFEAQDKKGRKTPIESYDDLIKLNYQCWKATVRKNSSSYVHPSKPWIDEFYQRNLIKRQVFVVPVDDTEEDYED